MPLVLPVGTRLTARTEESSETRVVNLANRSPLDIGLLEAKYLFSPLAAALLTYRSLTLDLFGYPFAFSKTRTPQDTETERESSLRILCPKGLTPLAHAINRESDRNTERDYFAKRVVPLNAD